MALRVGHEKLTRETGWKPKVSWEDGVLQTIRWYAENRDRWIGRVDWLPTGAPLHEVVTSPRHRRRRLPRLASRRAARGATATTSSSPRQRRLRPHVDGRRRAAVRRRRAPTSSSTSPPRSAASARTARTPAATGTRTSPWALNVLEQARLHETPKLVIVGTVCAYPKFAPVPFREDDLWNGYPEETNAPYGVAKKAVLVGAQAYREQYGLNSVFLLPDEPLRAARQLRPRDVARDPGADPQDGRGRRTRSCLWGDGSPTREFLYVDDCVEGFVLAAERYDGAEPVNLGAGQRDLDPRARRARSPT